MVSLYQKVVDMKMSNKLRPLAHRKLIVVTATCLTRARALTVVHPSLQCLQHNTDCGMSGMASGRVLISGQDGVTALLDSGDGNGMQLQAIRPPVWSVAGPILRLLQNIWTSTFWVIGNSWKLTEFISAISSLGL